jgi:predicted transcriptional regulator
VAELNFYIATLVSERMADALDREAERRKRSRSFVVREAIREHLERGLPGEAAAGEASSP